MLMLDFFVFTYPPFFLSIQFVISFTKAEVIKAFLNYSCNLSVLLIYCVKEMFFSSFLLVLVS